MKSRYLVPAVILALTGLCLSVIALITLPCALMAQPLPNTEEESLPPDVMTHALVPVQVLDETPCNWRPVLEAIFQPAVKDCSDKRDVILTIASRIGELTGVHYNVERRHPCMNALESLEEKKVSCTGQSILLVCALRSVGIPARAVGVASWNHVPGNHTWVEAWYEGQWHMIEFNEKEFNTPWVMEAIGMLNPEHPAQRVLAVHPGGAHLFPTVWNRESGVRAEDVTGRYMELARQWYARNGVPENVQKLMVDVLPRSNEPRSIVLEDKTGRELARTSLPTTQDDMRRFATLLLPRDQPSQLRIEGVEQVYPLHSNESAVQLLLLQQVEP